MRSLKLFLNLFSAIGLCSILAIPLNAPAQNCLPTLKVIFSEDGHSVTVKSNKQLSNVVLQFCDGSSDYKFDNLSAYEQTFSYAGKSLSGVWVKSGCNQSGDGPGYGKFFKHECCDNPPKPPEEELILICYNPKGSSTKPEQRRVTKAELATLSKNDYTLGKCPEDCMGIPGGQATVDLCGVCGGNSKSCEDCAGKPNGSAKRDVCGVCNGDGKSCAGCDGVPNSGKVNDICGVCGGDNSTCKDCKGVPNGMSKVDACGVCGGAGTSCLDCKGTPNGTSRIDICGVCGGDGSSCTGGSSSCAGTVDKCGVCNGNNACLDCKGVPNGGATIDCCGICGGDGDPKNCPDLCKVYETKQLKRQFLRRLKALYGSVREYSGRFQKCAGNTSGSRSRVAKATTLFKESKKLLGSFIQDKIKVCDTQWCSKTSFTSVITTLQTNTKALYKFSSAAQYGSINACGTPRVGGSSSKTSSTFKLAVGNLGKIPSSQCSN